MPRLIAYRCSYIFKGLELALDLRYPANNRGDEKKKPWIGTCPGPANYRIRRGRGKP